MWDALLLSSVTVPCEEREGVGLGLSAWDEVLDGPPPHAPHPGAATDLVPLDDVFQLAQQLGLDLLVQEDVGPGQAVVLEESRVVSGWGRGGARGWGQGRRLLPAPRISRWS